MTGGELLQRYAGPKTLAEACDITDEAWTTIGGSIEQPEVRAGNFPILQPAVDFCRHPDLGKCPDCHADLEDIERIAYKRGFQDAEALLRGERVLTSVSPLTDQQKAVQRAVGIISDR